MELTLSEVQDLLGISRYQVSRYAKDGRLQRTRQGHYDAASLANLHSPFDRYAYEGRDIAEKRAVWLVRAKHAFRRELLRIIGARQHRRHRRPAHPSSTVDEQREVEHAVKEYVSILAAMPER